MARYFSKNGTYTCPSCDLEFDKEHLVNTGSTPMTDLTNSLAACACPQCDRVMRIVNGRAFKVLSDMHYAYG